MVVVKVEAALPHCHRPRVREQRRQALGIAGAPARGLVRMHAERAPDVRVAMTESEDLVGLVEARRRHQEAAHTALARRVEGALALA